MTEPDTQGSMTKRTTALRKLRFWLVCSAGASLLAGCAPITQSFEQEAPPVQAGLTEPDTELTEHSNSEAEPETSVDGTEVTPIETTENELGDSLASTPDHGADGQEILNTSGDSGAAAAAALDKSEIEKIANDYRTVFLMVVKEAGYYDGSPSYDSLGQIEAEFRSVMSPEWAKMLTSFYFYEEDEMIWLIVTEPPVWLSQDEPYKIENKGQDAVRVVQQSQNEMLGPIRLVLELKQIGTGWVVDRHTVESLEL
ncbi:hypothetical protein D3C74_75310 [compost metagenome]